jgi:hypothetical protein
MAWTFSLSAECGLDKSKAMQFSQHFEGTTWTLLNDRQCQCRTDIFQDIEENSGLVLAVEIGQKLKVSLTFRSFCPGYIW